MHTETKKFWSRPVRAVLDLFKSVLSANLGEQMLEVTKRQWHIGTTSFGGPIVQYD